MSNGTARACSFEDCGKRHYQHGYCAGHIKQIRSGKQLAPLRFRSPNGIQLSLPCSVDGCEKQRKKHRPICSMHVARLARTGRVDKVVQGPRPRYLAENGYARVHSPQHDIADSTGYVYEHRFVLYAEIGPGAHRCVWCRREIHWRPEPGQIQLVVDHFNADRQDNHPANLLPSCQSCNLARVDQYEFHKDGTPRKKAC